MNIVYATDNNFVDVLYASIKSLYNANHDLKINLWIIADNVSDENKNKINNLSQEYEQRKICWVENVEIPYKLQLDRGSASAFSRLLLGSILPNNISKVLYLDSDIIVMNSLKELFDIDFKGNIVLGVADVFNKEYKKVLKIPKDKPIFNSGVMFIDLERWRKEQVENQLFEVIKDFDGKIIQGDQGVLNAVLYNSFKPISPKYNYMTIFEDMSYEEMITFKKPIKYYSKEEINQAKSQIVLRHFTTSFLSRRPWQEGSVVAHVDEFRHYYQGEYKIVRDDIFLKIFKIIPRKIAIQVVGIIQSKIRPKIYKILR